VEVRALTSAEAATIASWRYPVRYSTYDVDDRSILARDHWAVFEAGELVGYCCFGAPARVAGAQAQSGTLDVGYGLAPDRMGRGHGNRFVAAILEFSLARYRTQRFRLYILEWHERSRRVAARLGFTVEAVLQSDEGPFVVMIRNEHGADPPPHQHVSD
jgi:ribosomal-protein-alanine N-acetyltransferase